MTANDPSVQGRRTTLKLLAAGVLATAPLPALACEIFPTAGFRRFVALREGETVGEHRFSFRHEGGDFIVRADSRIAVSRFGGSFFALDHHCEEVWRNGWLQAVVSDTVENERRWRLRAERRSGIFQGWVNGLRFTVAGYPIPTSLWHHDTPGTQVLFSVVDGLTKVVSSRRLGEVRLVIGGQESLATRYELQGEIRRGLWYDKHCRLVRFARPLADGSQVLFVQT